MDTWDLGIDLAAFDELHSLTLAQASHSLRGKKNQPPHIKVIARWASPKRGRKVGAHRVVLPSVLLGGRRLTMPAWVLAFRVACGRLAGEASALPTAPTGKREEKRRASRLRDAQAQLDAGGVRADAG